MDTKSFIKKMKDMGDKYGKQGGGSGFITRIKIEFGFYVYGGQDHDRLRFWKPCANESEMEAVKEELQAEVNHAGVNEEVDFCLRVWTDKNVLNRDAFDWDNNAFYPRWQWDKKDDNVETCVSLILNSIEENDLPVEKVFWGRYQFKSNPYHVAQGEAGKKEGNDGKMYWPSFVLPVEVFASEQAARDATGNSSASSGNGGLQNWSETAQKNYDSVEDIESQANEIFDWLDKSKKGIPFNNDAENFPLPVPASPPKLKSYIASIYQLESSDIDLLTPF